MRYTIEGFNQQKLCDLRLDSVDAIILRWYVDFYFTGKMTKINVDMDDGKTKTFVWVNYQSVIDDLPILNIKNKEAIARRFKKICKCGLMEKYIKKEGGVYTAFRINESIYKSLIDSKNNDGGIDSKVDRSTQKSIGIDSKVETPIDSKVDTKDSLIKRNESIKLKEDIYTSIFDFWNSLKLKHHRKLTNDMKVKINKQLETYSDNEIKQAIKRYDEIVNSVDYYFTYKWSLENFLQRGIKSFDDDVCYSNFLKDKNPFKKNNDKINPEIEKYRDELNEKSITYEEACKQTPEKKDV
ncbi:MAG: hypothetical protein PHP92_04180 [Candidatus Nanoarchaeia archaeon]|nr:hypothetical protein [Candidatus Nanoarchaeia archaeon]